MESLKKAALEYISAKRAQKGYHVENQLNQEIDDKMLGKEKGSSIFTTKGKERYQFALNIIKNIKKTEKSIGSLEKKEPEKVMEDEGMSLK